MKRSEQGFSLVELMIVLVILTIVMGVIFQQIVNLQQRYKTEEIKADIFSEAREFTDQFVRDIHQTGYPGKTVYTGGALGAPPENDNRLAVGIVSATPTDLQIEADVDGDGLVDSVRYTLIAGPGNTCPCTLQRSQVIKLNGTAPWNQPTTFNTEVQGIVNSVGLGAGGAALPINGTSLIGNVTSNDDVLFAPLKTQAVFGYYDATGTLVNVNTNVSTGAGQTAIAAIKSVRIVINIVANTHDPRTGWKPHVTLSGTARVTNCSFYATC